MTDRRPPPPSPTHILRTHSSQIKALYFSDDNERLYSGDVAGIVVVTSTRSLRLIANWQAHTDGLLGIQEWEDSIITHGRDHKLHVWKRPEERTASVGNSAVAPGLRTPELSYSMDVNALNYCRFSLLPLPESAQQEGRRALIALPNLVESSIADIWTLPGRQRLHAAIGKDVQEIRPENAFGRNSMGIIMALHLFQVPHPHLPERTELRLLCAYENGSVTAYVFKRTDKETSVEGIGWEKLWTAKLHVESVMAMAVSSDNKVALSVSADHLIGSYDLHAAEIAEDPQTACVIYRTKHPGNAAITIRDDGKICAVGGWDGKIRLYSVKTMKPLGTLDYHKTSCQAVAFARSAPIDLTISGGRAERDGDSDDEMDDEQKTARTRWLAAGGQDSRVSIWRLIDFGNRS